MHIEPGYTRIARIAVGDEDGALGQPELSSHHLLGENEDQDIDGKPTARVVSGDSHTEPGRCRRFERIGGDHRLVLPPSEKLLAVCK